MENESQRLPSWSELFENAPCGLLATDSDGTIRLVNTTFCDWIGYKREELVGRRRMQDLYTVGSRLFHHTHWLPLMQMQGSASEVKLDVVHQDGRRIPMLFNAVSRKHGSHLYHELAVIVANDRHKYEQELLLSRKKAESALTEQQRMQQELARSRDELARADRRKDEFLATLGHELRNPLSSMHNVLALLGQLPVGDAEVERLHGVLERQVNYLTRLVGDLLDVSRIGQGKLQLQKGRVELADAVRDAVELVQSAIRAAAQDLAITLPRNPVIIDADPVRLTQVIMNLLHNATKYTPQGGRIALTVEREGAYAVICVRDSGIGIPPAQLGKVFDMFSQVAPMAERSQGGLGIGLALAHSIVALHGGTIEARSEGSGRGSEFTVRLPVLAVRGVTGATPAAQQTGAGRTGRRIVVIDDNQEAAESLAMLLELEGHAVRAAADGLTGLQLAHDVNAEAVLLDIGLPGIDGFEVARRIRREPWGKHLLLVAISGWSQAEQRERASSAGFDHYLTKPVSLDELNALLRKEPRS